MLYKEFKQLTPEEQQAWFDQRAEEYKEAQRVSREEEEQGLIKYKDMNETDGCRPSKASEKIKHNYHQTVSAINTNPPSYPEENGGPSSAGAFNGEYMPINEHPPGLKSLVEGMEEKVDNLDYIKHSLQHILHYLEYGVETEKNGYSDTLQPDLDSMGMVERVSRVNGGISEFNSDCRDLIKRIEDMLQ